MSDGYASDEEVAAAQEAVRKLDKLAFDTAAAVVEALIAPDANVLRAQVAGLVSADVTERARRTSAFFQDALDTGRPLLSALTRNTEMHLVRGEEEARAAMSAFEWPESEVVKYAELCAPYLLEASA